MPVLRVAEPLPWPLEVAETTPIWPGAGPRVAKPPPWPREWLDQPWGQTEIFYYYYYFFFFSFDPKPITVVPRNLQDHVQSVAGKGF